MYFADEMITGPARFDVDSQSGVGVTVVKREMNDGLHEDRKERQR